VKPLLILCLGNEILSDDGFGPAVARQMEKDLSENPSVEVVFASVAGLNLLDLINRRRRVLIVDTILTGQADAGHIHFFPADTAVPSRALVGSHQVSLPVALTLGGHLGLDMPERIDILAVEAGDVCTLSEQMTEPIAAAVEPAIRQIRQWLNDQAGNLTRERKHETNRTSEIAVS
jgi:hydrogenase maturation protease